MRELSNETSWLPFGPQRIAVLREAAAVFWSRAIRPAWIIVASATPILCLLCVVTPFDYAPWPIVVQRVALVAAMIAMSMHFAWKRWPRTALCLEALALSIATVLVMPPLGSIMASAAFPYQDATLLWIDKQMGIEWLDVGYWFRDQAAFTRALSHIYVSIAWQPPFLLAALAYCDPERLRRMLSASAMALVVTLLGYMFFPALGPYEHYKFGPDAFPSVLAPGAWVAPAITEGLRNGANQTSFEGLVTFPSFHAATAILFAYGWRAVPIVGWPFVALNVLMLISCVPIGSHYVIDVIVGVSLAAAGFILANRYFTKTDAEAPLPTWRGAEDGRKALAMLSGVPLLGRWADAQRAMPV
ncbi:MAG: phosphatase PAP2 family protein [Hyphomicrobium sp.]